MRIKAMICSVFLVFTAFGDQTQLNSGNKIDYKQKMREFVIGISKYAKAINPNFAVIPQNGIELVTTNGNKSGHPYVEYLNAIDANGQEELFYGLDADNIPTNSETSSYLSGLLDISKKSAKSIFVIDYCSTPSKVSDSYIKNVNKGYISFAANRRDLSTIPNLPNPIFQENNLVINTIKQAKNFLFLINTVNYTSKADFINDVISTNYDVLIMDLFFEDNTAFTSSEIDKLKHKANGGKRLVICYMSIGEAENYRYYWQPYWNTKKPDWLGTENPNWPGNFKVKYWNTQWKQFIYGNDNSYLKKILDARFDGVYLDLIDAFEYYEQK